jgi:hypothetical protein
MINTTPYDHTTPPSSPQTNSQSHTVKPSCAVSRSQAAVKPRQTTPAATYTPLGECRTVARDGMYCALRKSASCPNNKISSSTTKSSVSKATSRKKGGFLAAPLPSRPKATQDKVVTHKPEENLLRDLLQDDVPQASTMPKAPKSNNMTTIKATSNPTATKTKVKKDKPLWVSRLCPRPSDIFNMSFSFSTPSRRRLSDHTPQISPRASISPEPISPTPTPEEPTTCPSISSDSSSPAPSPPEDSTKSLSVSSDSSPPKPTREESPKRQRFDSSGVNMSPLPIPHTLSTHHSGGYNLGPTPTGPANIWFAEDIMSFRPVSTLIEAHPGFPVDFATLFSNDTPPRKQDDEEEYHAYLNEQRHRENLSPNQTRIFHLEMDELQCSTTKHQKSLSKEARILGLPSIVHIPNTTRANNTTVQRKSYDTARTSASGSTRTGRTSSSQSDPSTDRFLTHVRKSQEARRRHSASMNSEVWLGADPL